MSTMQLPREGAVYLLTLTNGELANTLTADVLGSYRSFGIKIHNRI